MQNWQMSHAPARPATPQRELVTVDSVKRFGGNTGIYKIRWMHGPRKRSILVAIEEWSSADTTIAAAVAATYPPGECPIVIVPTRAWR